MAMMRPSRLRRFQSAHTYSPGLSVDHDARCSSVVNYLLFWEDWEFWEGWDLWEGWLPGRTGCATTCPDAA